MKIKEKSFIKWVMELDDDDDDGERFDDLKNMKAFERVYSSKEIKCMGDNFVHRRYSSYQMIYQSIKVFE